jgi:hypothetical protein
MPDAYVCPYLIGVEPKEVGGTPLGQYQCTVANKDDTWRLIRDLNRGLEHPHDETLLRGSLDARWSWLHRRLEKNVPGSQPDAPQEKGVDLSP